MEDQTGWHGVGAAAGKTRTAKAALRTMGLGWLVEREPQVNPRTGKVTEWDMLVRSDTGQEVGMVRRSYEVHQNHEAFAWLDAPGLKPHVGGALHGGRRAYAVASYGLPRAVKGERVRLQVHVAALTCHDGKGSLQVSPVVLRGDLIIRLPDTPVRRARHGSAGIDVDQVRQDAEELGQQAQALANHLLKVSVDAAGFELLLDAIKPVPANSSPPSQARVRNTRYAMQAARDRVDASVRDTAWGALLAVVEFNNYDREHQGSDKAEARGATREEYQLMHVLFERQDIIPAALEYLLKELVSPTAVVSNR